MLMVLAPIIVFGLVVFVHELGHFLAAKWAGVYAPRFSIGFGPALWKRRYGETEYILAALPLGGFVRMASRHDDEGALLEGGSENVAAERAARGERPVDWDAEAMIPFGPKPIPEHRWFESKPLWKRLVIMLAGVTMNVLLALVISIGLVAHFGRTNVPTSVVGAVRASAKLPALPTLLQVGDTIRAINGRPVSTWRDVERQIMNAPGVSLSVRTHRGEFAVAAGGPASEVRQQFASGVDFYIPPVIDTVLAGQPAAAAGLRKGDSVVAIAGSPVRSFSQLVEHVSAAPGRPLVFRVIRGGAPVEVTVRPVATPARDPVTRKTVSVGRIGAGPPDVTVHEAIGFGEAIREGAARTLEMAGTIVSVVRGLFKREVGVDQLGGPIAIVRASVDAGRQGIEYVLGLLALISINVAVLNLLPIPILDGGQVLLNVAESVKGSAFSVRTREYVLRLGLLAILLLFVLVMFNDLKSLLRGLVGS
ncbi:MAG: RIP metalloprotease RseP [Gemmatimonadaceae bacterium]